MQQRVGQDKKPHTQRAVPLLLVLAVDGHGILATVGEQPRNLLVRPAIEPSVPDDCHLFVDKIFGAKVVIEAVQREADYVCPTDQPAQNAGECSFATAWLAHEQEKFLLARIQGEKVAKDFLHKLAPLLSILP